MVRTRFLSAFFWLLPATLFAAGTTYVPTDVTPPKPPREFRGAWIAAVATNQDWPSKPGLTVAQQKAELIALLDRATQLHLNAIIFQVRPSADAMYASPIEPWSERITGAKKTHADRILIRAVIEWRANLDAVAGQLANIFPQNSMFAGDLTRRGSCVLLWPLQPKSGFLPEAECGGTSSGA